MPLSIFLYNIDSSFGPSVIAEYNLTKEKITKEILKKLEEKHVKKDYSDATTRKDNLKFYSSKIKAETIKKDLYLGFILKPDEDIISLKSVFEDSEKKIIAEFSEDKSKMQRILKDIMNSILTLMEKLKEPKMIVETINEKTKKMLDEGKLQEARELIDLGEKIPLKLAEEVKIAEKLLKDGFFKKAKKSFLKASELAGQIRELEIMSFLENKAEQVGSFPDLIKERENILKDVYKIQEDMNANILTVYQDLIEKISQIVSIAYTFEEDELLDDLTDLMNQLYNANNLAKKIYQINKKVNEHIDNSFS